VLKPKMIAFDIAGVQAAAFGQLCVETLALSQMAVVLIAAAFGQLCVETVLVIQLYLFF